MLKQLSILGAFLLLPALAPASDLLDRAAKALDQGEKAKARFLYKQVLDAEPCDEAARSGLAQADGDPAPYKQRCAEDAPAADAPADQAAAAAEPAATPAATEAPMELPKEDHRPASLRGEPQPGRDVTLAAGVPATAADDAAADDAAADDASGANDIGAQAKGHRHGGGPRRSRLQQEHPLLAWVASPSLWLSLLGVGVLAAAVALGIVAVAKRRRAVPAEGGVDAVSAAEGAGVAIEASEPSAPAPPAAPPVAPVAPASASPLALPPEQAAAMPAAWTSPLTPGEAVIARVDSAQAQAGLTAHQFFFQGPRGVKAGWFSRPERLTLAVPLHQVTGLGWAERGGERLIVGTALAGDIALNASDFGALALRQFAQALSKALDRPLA